ncbi:glucose-6-phosphate isomerase [Sphingomonas sp. ASV193]|uniref:glucose-6-phosphate isomerase n=1 Tax=Sphingomonas sp. ASV193 TaxID=3144405 RepID=UPI0032E9136D
MQTPDLAADWKTIDSLPRPTLAELFAGDEGRVGKLTRDVAGIHFDWSKTHLDEAGLAAFEAMAKKADYNARRAALFAGEVVNPSEDRPATHVAERGEGAAHDNDLARRRHRRMREFIDAVEGGAFGEIESVLHIGIGGSALGPDLMIDALGRESDRFEVRVLSNIDGEGFDAAVAGLDPKRTLVVAVSKTFTTTETITNLETAIEWMVEGGVEDAYGRLVACTAAPDKAVEFGIDETRVLPFGEGVGGRYSLWSSVGLSIAMALGWAAFEEMLEGAAEMDRHVRKAEGEANIALLAAFADQYYVMVRHCETRALFAYDERLRLLPSYLQQLEMESNGKSASIDNRPLGRPSAPITWGGTGTDAQHAVFQLLHQGTHLVPVEFIAVIEQSDSVDERHHQMLLGNALAQGAALMAGRHSDDAARNYPGDRPSTTILLPRLEPRHLGALIAFYEHRTFANAVIMGNNPFDQFGVELGKEMAKSLDDPEGREKLDASTKALLEKAGL